MVPFQRFSRPIPCALALSLLVTLFPPSPSGAQSAAADHPAAADSATANKLANRWEKMEEDAARLLREERYARSKRKLRHLIDQMMRRLGPGPGGEHALGNVLMHRAVAEAGLGHRQAALWDWDVARQLHPALGEADLERLGPAARVLTEPPRHPRPAPDDACTTWNPEWDSDAQVVPPRARRRGPPEYPPGARSFGLTGATVICAVITREGDVVRPVVLEEVGAATITYAVLEAVRHWKFEPARLDGRPLGVHYALTVTFDVR